MTTDVAKSDLYEVMVRIRLFEEQVARRFRAGELPGFVHLSIGQEAIAAGVCAALERSDWITTTHRGHGHVIAKGADMKAMVAELRASPDGCCRGVGGSMHLVDIDSGVLSAGAIVGGTIPLALGAAFAFSQRQSRQVAVCFFGDGAVNQGVLHESLNIASLWRLPLLFVCENNGYAEMTPSSVHTNVANLADHASLYSIPAHTIDGNDPTAVYEAAWECVTRARNCEGPSFLECLTFRVSGHFEGDQQKYRSEDEALQWANRDPLDVITRGMDAEAQSRLPETFALAERAVVAAFEDTGVIREALTVSDLEELTYAGTRSG